MNNEYENKVGAPLGQMRNPEPEPNYPRDRKAMGLQGVGQRMSGRVALREEAICLRRKADALDALASQVPDGWPHNADEALWQLVCDSRR